MKFDIFTQRYLCAIHRMRLAGIKPSVSSDGIDPLAFIMYGKEYRQTHNKRLYLNFAERYSILPDIMDAFSYYSRGEKCCNKWASDYTSNVEQLIIFGYGVYYLLHQSSNTSKYYFDQVESLKRKKIIQTVIYTVYDKL